MMRELVDAQRRVPVHRSGLVLKLGIDCVWAGLVLLLAVVGLALLAPAVALYDPLAQNLANQLEAPFL
jgi:hypothetical protein